MDRIIRLRTRLMQRLEQNQEVIGTDESFFGEQAKQKLHDLYTEKRVLDDDADEEVDLVSFAQQVWNSAAEADRKAALALPPVVPAARPLPETALDRGGKGEAPDAALASGGTGYQPGAAGNMPGASGEVPSPKAPSPLRSAGALQNPPGAITYLRFPDRTDALVRVDAHGNLVSQSLSTIFRAAACPPDTPALPRAEHHHDLVARCVQIVTEEQTAFGGQLGSLRSVRRKLWERLDRYRTVQKANPTLFTSQLLAQLEPVLDLLWRFPLKRTAQDDALERLRARFDDPKKPTFVSQLDFAEVFHRDRSADFQSAVSPTSSRQSGAEAAALRGLETRDTADLKSALHGFDLLVGNPPYVRIQVLNQTAPEQVAWFKTHYVAASKGNYDLYVVFVERGLQLLNARGQLAYILPHKFFNAQYGQPLRELLARGRHLRHVVHFGDQQIFPGATNAAGCGPTTCPPGWPRSKRPKPPCPPPTSPPPNGTSQGRWRTRSSTNYAAAGLAFSTCLRT